MSKKGTLVLVRHGQSRFNELNIFAGWLDVSLSEKGIRQAHRVAEHCKHFDYDAVFTSHLKRAHETLTVILSKQNKIGVFQHESDERYDIPNEIDPNLNKKILKVYSNRALNERAYGDLQGMNKGKALKTYGKGQMSKWRRGFSDRPPRGESLEDVYKRVILYIEREIMPHLKSGETILIVSHGNTLRAIVKYLEDIDDDKIPFISLPLGQPLVYEYDNGDMKRTDGEYIMSRNLEH